MYICHNEYFYFGNLNHILTTALTYRMQDVYLKEYFYTLVKILLPR